MKKKRIKQWMASKLDLPADVLLDVPRVTMIGQFECRLDQHLGIRQYHPDLLIVNTAYGLLAINGEGLEIVKISGTTMVIQGSIHSMAYTEERKPT
ncbi:sporulation protein YqfC [Salsuginibacillus halophilus]|uniref:Sporulation protein YqfC n=1 Tax=Salsuginibacillus halophilus TaxID=517424 RepID=A0A2P8HFQ2_9BACI|nr:sporulation protein YqfC [Salsuginibacillus halophilus]PSL45024.1 sporulation protein YqfC [Salsuginibacillus halophilus]